MSYVTANQDGKPCFTEGHPPAGKFQTPNTPHVKEGHPPAGRLGRASVLGQTSSLRQHAGSVQPGLMDSSHDSINIGNNVDAKKEKFQKKLNASTICVHANVNTSNDYELPFSRGDILIGAQVNKSNGQSLGP